MSESVESDGLDGGWHGARDLIQPADLTMSVGFALRQTHAQVQREFAAALAPLDLTISQYCALELIADNPGCSRVDLAVALAADRSSMMTTVHRLLDLGVIRRTVSSSDRRRQELNVSHAGTVILDAARQSMLQADEALLSGDWAPEDQGTFVAALKRIYQSQPPRAEAK